MYYQTDLAQRKFLARPLLLQNAPWVLIKTAPVLRLNVRPTPATRPTLAPHQNAVWALVRHPLRSWPRVMAPRLLYAPIADGHRGQNLTTALCCGPAKHRAYLHKTHVSQLNLLQEKHNEKVPTYFSNPFSYITQTRYMII